MILAIILMNIYDSALPVILFPVGMGLMYFSRFYMHAYILTIDDDSFTIIRGMRNEEQMCFYFKDIDKIEVIYGWGGAKFTIVGKNVGVQMM